MEIGFSSLIVLVLLIAEASGDGQSQSKVCSSRVSMSHQAVLVPFSEPAAIKIPLYIRFACSRTERAIGRKTPLIVLMQGALLRPRDYSRFANRLARQGFVVAIPDYTKRDLVNISPAFAPIGAFIAARRSMGFRCPKRPQFGTTKLISSVQQFFKSGARADFRRAVDLSKVVIFGHSYGGDVSNRFFNAKCEAVGSPIKVLPENVPTEPSFFQRVQCEQFSPETGPTAGVLGIVTYEGVNNRTVVDISGGNFHVAIYSSFYQNTISNVFSGKAFNRLTATVRLQGANHYGPNNYQKQSDNQTPICALERRPPEDMFLTTRQKQNAIVDTITEVVVASFNTFVKKRRLEPLKSLTFKEKLLVDEVVIQ